MPRGSPRVHVGTSGWSYKDWPGRFYPKELPQGEWLEFYAEKFDTVELNASFYRLPFENVVASWNRRLPTSFHLVAKGHRRITHMKKLTGVEADLGWFHARMLKLEPLRVLLWQLPPSLRLNLERLEGFLELLPGDVRHAVEFRHESWWCDEVVELLDRHKVALVAVSHPGLPADILPTTDFLYLRFHGAGEHPHTYEYSDAELSDWVERIEPLLPGRTLYAFFNNDFEAHAPKNAATFRGMLGQG